ncbi:MAG: rhodanese-like domain-containing protein [Candidatus Competibacterales bacterium]
MSSPLSSTPSSSVAAIPPASPALARAHFGQLLALETDCWDVHHALTHDQRDFVLLDVRSPEAFAQGHLPKALNLPHRDISPERLAEFPVETLFVVYCAGPHCNGADRAAVGLATLGRPVKKMIGGVTGWRDEGFELVGNG